MQNFPLSETESKPEGSKVVGISEPFKTPGDSVFVESKESPLSSQNTIRTATTSPSLKKTSPNLDFPSLRLQASLLAGGIGEWLIVEGTRAKSETVLLTQPNGKKFKAIRIFLAIDDNDLEVVETSDGVDFAVNGERVKVVEDVVESLVESSGRDKKEK